MGSRKTKEQFIADAKKLFGDYYDYSLVDYVNNNTKVKIICPVHGVFEQVPRNHTSGIGCWKCGRVVTANKTRHTTAEFIENATKIHGDKYDYSEVEYTRTQDKVKIICKKHGAFYQRPNQHIKGNGCPVCGFESMVAKTSSNTERYVQQARKILGDRYDYSKVNYKNYLTNIEIVCREHGSFFQLPYQHLKGKGCPICSASTGEKEIIDYLNQKKLDFVYQKTFDDLSDVQKLRYDFYVPSKNLLIEYNGVYHYKVVNGDVAKYEYQIKHDKMKSDYAKKNNIPLLVIKYTENVKERLQEVLKVS